MAVAAFLPILYAVITLFAKVWQLNKGLVMSDEAYYLYLLKEMPRLGVTQFYMYFQNIFQGNIIAVRLTALLLNLLGTFVFSYGLYSYFKDELKLIKKNFYILWSLAFVMLFGGIFSLWICYFTLNQFVVFVAIGLILLGLKNKIKWFATIGFILSGFFLGTLFFVMITNVPILFFATILVYFLSEKGSRITNSLLLIIGVFLSVTVYFIFFDNLFLYIDAFKETLTSTAKIEDGHGVVALKQWIEGTFLYFVKTVFIGVLVMYALTIILKQKSQYSSWIKIITVTLFLIFIASVQKYNFKSDPFKFPSTTPFFIAYLYAILILVAETKVKLNNKNFLLFCFVFLVPVFLSFGTDVSLELRAVMYISFYLPFIYIILKFTGKHWRKIYFVFVLLISIYFFHSLYLYSKDNFAWFDIVYTKQNIPVKSIGINQNIYLDETKFANLKELKNELKEGDHVIFGSDYHLWGYMYLLGVQPVSYSFYFKEEEVLTDLRKKPVDFETFKCISWKNWPIDALLIDKIKEEIKADTIIQKDLSSVIIYSFR